jgi:hypothetical protein
MVVNNPTGDAVDLNSFDANGTVTVRLPKGSYDVNAMDVSDDPADTAQPTAVALVSRPGVALTANTSVTLDATAGRPVDAVVDTPG